jgi:tRNA(Met) C34 N-acetyltransferase TmcA
MSLCCVRYGAGDKVEAWLNELLCLNASEHVPKPPPHVPAPDECELFYVERDTLFSFHKVPHPQSFCLGVRCFACAKIAYHSSSVFD